MVINGFSKLYAMTGWRPGVPDRPVGLHPSPPEDAPELFYLRELFRPVGRDRSPQRSGPGRRPHEGPLQRPRKFMIRRREGIGWESPWSPPGILRSGERQALLREFFRTGF